MKKTIKIALIILLSLVIVVALAWYVIYYLVWPKPEILKLVPSTPLVYVAASNLGKTVPDVKGSEFVNRIAKSPMWRDFKSSMTWQQIMLQKRLWERQMESRIDEKWIVQIVGKDALLAFYGGQKQWNFLLISEVVPITRINLTSGSTKRRLASKHEFAEEEYKGIELMTVESRRAAPLHWKYSYGFIGRIGLLSTDESLLKEVVDVYRGSEQGLAATSGFKKLVVDLPDRRQPPRRVDISFYINTAKIREASGLSNIASVPDTAPFHYLTSAAQRMDAWAGVWFRRHGDLRLDLRGSLPHEGSDASNHNIPGDSMEHGQSLINQATTADNNPAVPANCLIFLLHETLESKFLFEMLGAIIGPEMDVARDRLPPVLHNGMSVAVLEPNFKEFELLPPVVVSFHVKDRATAETALKSLKNSLKIGGRQLEFIEVKHENIPINYARLPIVMGMSIDVGHTIVGDDLLIIATGISALKSAIDVALGKQPSLVKGEQYINVLAPIVEASEGQIFINVGSIAAITKQAAKLYAWQARIAGNLKAEQIATMLYQNAFALESWQHVGAAFNSNDGKVNVKLIMSGENKQHD